MTAIVDGVLKKDTIELLKTPDGMPEGRVRVIVIAEGQTKPPSCLLTFGKYQTGRMSSLEDFADAQWRGEAEFDPNRG